MNCTIGVKRYFAWADWRWQHAVRSSSKRDSEPLERSVALQVLEPFSKLRFLLDLAWSSVPFRYCCSHLTRSGHGSSCGCSVADNSNIVRIDIDGRLDLLYCRRVLVCLRDEKILGFWWWRSSISFAMHNFGFNVSAFDVICAPLTFNWWQLYFPV